MKAVSFKNVQKFGASILLALMIIPTVLGIVVLTQQYQKSDIGALIDQQQQKNIKNGFIDLAPIISNYAKSQRESEVRDAEKLSDAVSEAGVVVGTRQNMWYESGLSNNPYYPEALSFDWGQKSKTQAIKKFEPAFGQREFHIFGGTLTLSYHCGISNTFCPNVSWVHYMR
jgi:hypothetical protein